jgi:hypothetical protein
MLEVLDKHPADFWEIPGTVEAVLVDTVSGYPEHDGYAARSEYIIKGTLPALPDPIHTKLKLCRGQDKLASDVDIEKHEYDEKEFYVFTEDVTLSGVPSWQEGIDAWIASQGDEKYHVPKEYCDTADEVVVRVEAPEDKQEFSDNEVAVRVRVITQGELDRVEIWVDGARRESLVTRPYETKLTLVTGRHSVKVIAIRRDGKRGESGEVRIGVGGESWEEAEPTPTPSPTLKPVPSKTPKPTAIELPDDT